MLQDSAQGFHWNNSQATLHPFVAYYLDSEEVRHLSYVVISDCLHHDMVAVHLFQKSFINFLKNFLPSALHPKKIIYFSDGAASQYKNSKISSICVARKMILELQLNSISQPFRTERVIPVMVLVEPSNN